MNVEEIISVTLMGQIPLNLRTSCTHPILCCC